MIEPSIEISYDEVKIENCIVLRPGKISAKQWIEFWESVKEIDPKKESELVEKIEELYSEVESLRRENSYLHERIAELEMQEG